MPGTKAVGLFMDACGRSALEGLFETHPTHPSETPRADPVSETFCRASSMRNLLLEIKEYKKSKFFSRN